MPVLLLGGTQDAIRDTEKIAARLGELVPHLTAVIIPGGRPRAVRYEGPNRAILGLVGWVEHL